MIRVFAVFALAMGPSAAFGFCVKKPYVQEWSEQVEDHINYLLCLHDEQQQDIAKLSEELIRANTDIMLAREKIDRLEAEVVRLERTIED